MVGGIHHLGGQLLLTWLVVMGGRAVFQIGELIGSTLSGVSVGDYANNALDLVANATGATDGVVLVLWFEQRVPNPTGDQRCRRVVRLPSLVKPRLGEAQRPPRRVIALGLLLQAMGEKGSG
ncbi:MAG TPA: hypothetical protein VF148_05245 [Acidimicrobiia bacterium]